MMLRVFCLQSEGKVCAGSTYSGLLLWVVFQFEKIFPNVKQIFICFGTAVGRYHFNPRREFEEQTFFSGEATKSEMSWIDANRSTATTSDETKMPFSSRVPVNRKFQNRGGNSKFDDFEFSRFALKCVRACSWALERRFASLSPKSIVCCLYEFACLHLMPWRLLLQMQRRLRSPTELQQLCGRGLAQLSITLSQFHHRDGKLLRRISRIVHQREQNAGGKNALSNRSLCMVLHAFSALGFRDQHLLQVATHRIEKYD